MLIALRRIALLAIIAAGLLSAPSVWSQSVPLSSGGSSLATPVSIADGGTNATTFTTSNGVTKYDGTRLVTGVWVDTGTLLYSTTATGLGLGTATPFTVATENISSTGNKILQVKGGSGYGILAATGDTGGIVDFANSAGSRLRLLVAGANLTLARLDTSGATQSTYMTTSGDAITLGSASVAGVNYVSGTGVHTFSDGSIIQAGTGATDGYFLANGTAYGMGFLTGVGTALYSNSIVGVRVLTDGSVALADNANGKAVNVKQITELHTLAAAGTSATTIQFPANALILGVAVRVTTEITGCATFQVGDSGSATRYGTGLALTAGTTNQSGGTTNPTIPSAAQAIRFTCVGGGASFTAGVVRVVGYYIDMTAPTSMLPALDMMRQIAAADPQLRRAA